MNRDVDECCICLEDMVDDLVTLRCGHKLHQNCYDLYKTYKTKENKSVYCPICRRFLKLNIIGSMDEECMMGSLCVLRLFCCGLTTYLGLGAWTLHI